MDTKFPYDDTMMYIDRDVEGKAFTSSRSYGWLRPEDVVVSGTAASEEWLLLDDAKPADVIQGRTGNCW